MSSHRIEEERPALPVRIKKPELVGLCTDIKGIALEGEDSPMEEEFSNVAPAATEPSPSLHSLSLPEPPTPMDLSYGTASWVNDGLVPDDECHTPRGEEYRIPEILTCPLAPRRPIRNNTAVLELSHGEYFWSVEMEEVLKQEEDGAVDNPSISTVS